MEELNYTTLADIKEFLQKLNIYWLGKIIAEGTEKTASIEDFKHIVTLKIYNNHPNKNADKQLKIIVTDKNFYIVDLPDNHIDLSLRWQAFMITKKDKSYAKFIYEKCNEEKKEKEKMYNEKINLVKKLEESLRYQKTLEMAKLNTAISNATYRLEDVEISKDDTLFTLL